MKWYSVPFVELPVQSFHDLVRLRIAVFVVEQGCAYQEVDGLDPLAQHLYAANDKGEVLAVCRIIPAGELYDEVSIGRVATAVSVRGTGLGRELFQYAMEETKRIYGHVPVKIMAQYYLEKFYASFGFETVSDVFLEDDIEHVYMIYNP